MVKISLYYGINFSLVPNAQILILDVDETLNITTTSNPAENDLTTTFLPSVEMISDNEDEIKTTVPVLFSDLNPMTTQQTILTTSTIAKSNGC